MRLQDSARFLKNLFRNARLEAAYGILSEYSQLREHFADQSLGKHAKPHLQDARYSRYDLIDSGGKCVAFFLRGYQLNGVVASGFSWEKSTVNPLHGAMVRKC